MKSFHERPGAELLIAYHQRGNGVDLLRAYLERRQADQAADAKWRASHAQKLAKGMPSNDADAAFERQIRLNILSALDPVMADLVRCGADASLAQLREALRLPASATPSIAMPVPAPAASTAAPTPLTTAIRWQVIALWLAGYGCMSAKGAPYRTDGQLKADIAAQSGVSEASALRYWRAFLKAEPTQAAWSKKIAEAAKGRPLPKLKKV